MCQITWSMWSISASKQDSQKKQVIKDAENHELRSWNTPSRLDTCYSNYWKKAPFVRIAQVVNNKLQIIITWCVNIHIASIFISTSLSMFLPCLQTCLSRKEWAAVIRFKMWIERMCTCKVKACLTFNKFGLWVEMSSPMCHTTHLVKLLMWLSIQELQSFQI